MEILPLEARSKVPLFDSYTFALHFDADTSAESEIEGELNIATNVHWLLDDEVSFHRERISHINGEIRLVILGRWKFGASFVPSFCGHFETTGFFLRLNDLIDVCEIIHKNHYSV